VEVPFFRVLYRDEQGFWTELSGGAANNQHAAEMIAKRYFEKSNVPTRVINSHAAILWSSETRTVEAVEASELPFNPT